MWSYYGAKTNIVDLYPAPKHGKIIEPFAGSARYALKYFDRDVLLVDKYEVVIRVWQWLQLCAPGDILNLPLPGPEQTTDNIKYDCEEAKWLVGFIIRFGVSAPGKTISPHYRVKRPNGVNFSLKRIANNLFKIRHWEIRQGDYKEIPKQEATHFIDPPYEDGGHLYIHSNKHINFIELAEWCKSRPGQVIVCEKISATWLNFLPLHSQRTKNGMQNEGIWCNEPTAYSNEQQKLFV